MEIIIQNLKRVLPWNVLLKFKFENFEIEQEFDFVRIITLITIY
jgi:hypothetical protein